MKDLVGKYSFVVDAYLSDFRRKATLPMIGGYMLQSATKHAEERGFGYSAMTGQNKAWVLTRMYIQMLEYPVNETQITMNTWVTGLNKLFTERCFSIEDQAGRPVGYARSLWSAMDLETRRATNILDLEGLNQYISDKDCPIESPSKIGSPKEGSELANSFSVKYSDIDINKHLNSIKYIEHFVDSFPIEMYQEKEIRDFSINYLSEGHYGENLDVLKSKVESDAYVLTMKNNEKAICTAKIGWQHIVGA